MRLVSAIVFLGLLLAPVPANAVLKVAAPVEVCAALKGVGLPTSGWKLFDDTFQCLSAYKEIGAAFPLPNNLAFYAKGGKATVEQVELMLNVNDPTGSAAALSELVNAARILCRSVSGEPLPAAAATAIKRGRNASSKAGVSSVDVKREEMLKGFSIQVLIR